MNRTWIALGMLALVAAGCPKKRDSGAAEPIDQGDVADIDTRLAVISIDPSRVAPGTPTEVTLRGVGFENGARVYVGAESATSVTVRDGSTLTARLPGLSAGTYDVEVVNPSGDTAKLRQGLTVGGLSSSECQNVVVYFDFDRDTLRGDAVSRLTERLDCWTGTTAGIVIEGHADARGTTDYNLALGQRRADAVFNWMVGRGVRADRITTVTYGEERPAVRGNDEAAHAANRRAEIKLR